MILFPLADALQPTVSPDADHAWKFRGAVRFRGHAGMLSVRLAAPELTVRGGWAEMTIEGQDSGPDAARVPLVDLQLERGPAPAGADVWLGSNVRLTEPGAALFNSVYPAGEPFEQLSVVLPAGRGA
jgi:hypothetical protein